MGEALRRIAPLLVPASVYLLCILLYRERLVSDGDTFLISARAGHWTSEPHFLYMPIVRVVAAVGQTLGLSLVVAMAQASALGVALGSACAVIAARRTGLGRGAAAMCGLLTGTVPSALFFGSVLEIHGVFFGACGLAWLAATTPRRRAGVSLTVGALCGIAAGTHASGHLLPITLWLFRETWPSPAREARLPRTVASGTCIALGHLAAWAASSLLVRGDLAQGTRDVLGYGLQYAWSDVALATPFVVVREWLWPFFPLWLLGLLAMLRTRRPVWIALHALVAFYLLLTIPTLGFLVENGAYLLPFAYPFALLATPVFRRRTLVAAIAGGIAIGAVIACTFDAIRITDASGVTTDDLIAVAAGSPCAMILGPGDPRHEIGARDASVQMIRVEGLGLDRERPVGDVANDVVGFARLLPRLVISRDAHRWLEREYPELLAALRERLVFERLDVAGFEGEEIRPRE
jgi:hypothetical protein